MATIHKFLCAAANGFLLDLSRVREKLEQGEKPVWSDERLAELRTKASKQ